jgi:hypothetical protein
MTTRRIFNVAQPIVFPNGTMQYNFRDFIQEVDIAITEAAITSVWGTISGTLSTQTDLQTALNGKATAAQGALADTAVQPGDNVSVLVNDSAYLVSGDNVSELTNDAGYLTAYAPPAVRDEATTPYTLVIGDANTVVRLTAAGAAVTIPQESSVSYAVGTELRLRFAGTGTPTLTTTGLTINGTIPTLTQNVELLFRKVGSDTWDLV